MTKKSNPDIYHIVVDTDTGIDDALALLYLAGRDNVELSAISSIYGNTLVESEPTNIARVLQVAGLDDVLVAKGATRPMIGAASIASQVHGQDGLGDSWLTPISPQNLAAMSSAELLVDLGCSRPDYFDL